MPPYGPMHLRENRPQKGIDLPSGLSRLSIGNVHDPTIRQRQEKLKKENDEVAKLNMMSKQVKEEICANLWATMYWKHLISRFISKDLVFIELSPNRRSLLPDVTKSSPASDTQRPLPREEHNNAAQEAFLEDETFTVQFEVLQRRYLDACEMAKPIWEGVERTMDMLIEDILGDPSEDEFAFRAFHKDKQAKFFESRGDMRCGNWHNFDIGNSFAWQEADDHRLWNIMKKFDWWKNAIAIIDLRVLKRLGIAYGSTKGNGHGELGLCGSGFANEEELLVAGWIPSRAIKGFLSYTQFKDLLTANGIENSNSYIDRKISYGDLQANFQTDWAEFQRQRR
ncbi:hypothetical protein B0T11DRAFT_300480 [Plectosphaerella cucumerina]|uniref:Uncharacterized protein n=1 Tax=Plectosphaerella cucumerina TaxID=40658 RepID=A0A8K0T7E0_9PEZI|nr:hypothetical protein B0T11DRAFT_300480 [Plectosphaerella cucumerina]